LEFGWSKDVSDQGNYTQGTGKLPDQSGIASDSFMQNNEILAGSCTFSLYQELKCRRGNISSQN
jgi:hypothetical protein